MKKIGLSIIYFAPFLVFAQNTTTVGSIMGIFKDILDKLVPLLITAALVFFIFGVVKYIMAQDDEEGRTKARSIMINGIIALFVIVSVWGLVAVLNSTFSVGPGGAPGGVPGTPSLE